MHALLKPVRQIAECEHRRLGMTGGVVCRLLSEWLGEDETELAVVSDSLCGVCCLEATPQIDRMNSVVASLWLERRRSLSDQPLAPGNQASRLDQLALDALPLVPPEFPSLELLIDPTLDAEVLAQYIEQGKPFTLLRYGDGEWYSLLGSKGYNCDGHEFLGDSMGRELRAVLSGVAKCSERHPRLFVGTTRELEERSRAVLSRVDGSERIHWVNDALFRLGMMNLKTLRFVQACREFSGRKVLVASHHLRPIARALNAHHVVIPLRNCYDRLSEVERLCRISRSDLVLSCASMASECLLWRLFQERPETTYVDCGSIFDSMLGNVIRPEYHGWSEVVSEHYAPLFQRFIRPESDGPK